MTCERKALTFERALLRIVGQIGWDGAASVVCKSESLVRKWASPGSERHITLRDALRLDLAYQREGGIGHPLLECYSHLIETAEHARPTQAELRAAAAGVAKEGGEAVAAALAITPGCDPKLIEQALVEAEEAAHAANNHVAVLKALNGMGG